MSTVRTSFGSPFGRKARIAIGVLGLDKQVKVESATTQDASDPIRDQNPLGKVPVLILDDGTTLFDSPVILEYLDHLAGGGKILPKEPKARFAALRLEALADGLMDASILVVYEGRFRPADKHVPSWVEMQNGKVERALDALEAQPLSLASPPTVGEITLACALAYRDFRFPGSWRDKHPKLAAWLERFASTVPAFEATKPPPA
jgi:glutathione S-transferase